MVVQLTTGKYKKNTRKIHLYFLVFSLTFLRTIKIHGNIDWYILYGNRKYTAILLVYYSNTSCIFNSAGSYKNTLPVFLRSPGSILGLRPRIFPAQLKLGKRIYRTTTMCFKNAKKSIIYIIMAFRIQSESRTQSAGLSPRSR